MRAVLDGGGAERHMMGWHPDLPDPRDKLFAIPDSFHLPDKVDLRSMCPPVVDQGQIGSCTANSSAAAMAFLERKGQQDAYFSRLFIYAKTREFEGTPLTEDSGARIRDVMKVLSTIGAPYECDYPYDTSKFSQAPSADVIAKAAQHKALFYYRCPNLTSVKASLVQGFPVVFGFSVPNNMMSNECAQTGIVLPPALGEGFDGGHAVLAVGYDNNFVFSPSVKGGVLCQNSWSMFWGIQGYFWLPMQFWIGGFGSLANDNWTMRRAVL